MNTCNKWTSKKEDSCICLFMSVSQGQLLKCLRRRDLPDLVFKTYEEPLILFQVSGSVLKLLAEIVDEIPFVSSVPKEVSPWISVLKLLLISHLKCWAFFPRTISACTCLIFWALEPILSIKHDCNNGAQSKTLINLDIPKELEVFSEGAEGWFWGCHQILHPISYKDWILLDVERVWESIRIPLLQPTSNPSFVGPVVWRTIFFAE